MLFIFKVDDFYYQEPLHFNFFLSFLHIESLKDFDCSLSLLVFFTCICYWQHWQQFHVKKCLPAIVCTHEPSLLSDLTKLLQIFLTTLFSVGPDRCLYVHREYIIIGGKYR